MENLLSNPFLLTDDVAWADRCGYWLSSHNVKRRPGRTPRHVNEPLVLTGHGMRLRIDNGALVVRNGFTYYRQKLDERRYFPGDRRKPSRIIVVDGSGSISFDVMDWLAEQNIPLIRIDWRGNATTVIGRSYGPNPKRVAWQYEALRAGQALPIAISLISQKLKNSLGTLKMLPQSGARDRAIKKQDHEFRDLALRPPRTNNGLLGVEGRAAYSYFSAWQQLPLRWKGVGRRPIPDDWHQIGPRTSGKNRIGTNRNATHPVNAMLNYAYAVLESQVRMQIAAEGYDPTIGFLHTYQVDRRALVFDLMEPMRPIVDRKVLEFVQAHTFHPADFTLRTDGVCRLNPELAGHVVQMGLVRSVIQTAILGDLGNENTGNLSLRRAD